MRTGVWGFVCHRVLLQATWAQLPISSQAERLFLPVPNVTLEIKFLGRLGGSFGRVSDFGSGPDLI